MFGTSSKNVKEPSSSSSSGTKGFADVARRLSTSLTAFGFKSQPNTPIQTSTSLSRQSAASMTAMMEETSEEPPQIAAAEEETEDIRERSVKVTFPKNRTTTDQITEEKIRIAASSFGIVVDVGMKEKLAVVLFAKSVDAFNFAGNHNGVLGEEFKVKFMGTQTQAFVSTAHAIPPINHPITTMVPKVQSTTSSSPTKAEKAAAAAKAAALLADQAAAFSSAVTTNSVVAESATAIDVEAEDMDATAGGSFQGITGDKHRDSKILLMNVAAAATTTTGSGGAINDIEGNFNGDDFTHFCRYL